MMSFQKKTQRTKTQLPTGNIFNEHNEKSPMMTENLQVILGVRAVPTT